MKSALESDNDGRVLPAPGVGKADTRVATRKFAETPPPAVNGAQLTPNSLAYESRRKTSDQGIAPAASFK